MHQYCKDETGKVQIWRSEIVLKRNSDFGIKNLPRECHHLYLGVKLMPRYYCSVIFEDCLRPETTDRLAAPCRCAGCVCGECVKCAREVTPHVFHPACLTSALVAGSTPRTWCALRWQWGRTTAMYPTITGCTPSPWRTPCTPWSRPVSTSSRTSRWASP